MVDYCENLIPHHICAVSFASDSQKRFEFFDTFHYTGIAFVQFRDSATKWYQNGIVGIGDRPAVITYIQRLTQRYSYVKTIGVSSGAYGALLYGQLAGVDEVIAISPVTGKEVDDFDPKWHSRILPIPGTVDPSPIDDLRQFFKEGSVPRIRAFVSDGAGTEIDYQMASRIGIRDITIIPGYGHAELARHMRGIGMLAKLIMEKF